jgi:YaiO family outer membrane protein
MNPATAALALSMLVLAVPAAAQTAEEDYQAGVAARQAGDPDEALRRLGRAAEAAPANADIHLQLGLAYLALGRLDEADAAFRRVLALAPDYADARLGLARVAQRRGDQATALVELDRLGPDHAEADQLRRQIAAAAAAAPWRWRIDLDDSYGDVDRLADWRTATLVVQHRPEANTTIGATADGARRFDRTDVYFEARVDHRFAPGASAYVLFGGTPEADYRPIRQFGAGGVVRVHGGPYATVLQLDLAQADYPTGHVRTVTPGIEQYIDGSAWVTVQWINVWDRFRHASGWLVRGDVMPSDRLRLFAGLANAPDLDAGFAIDTSSLFGGVSLDVGNHVTLRLSYAHEDPRGPVNRDTVALGMGYRF